MRQVGASGVVNQDPVAIGLSKSFQRIPYRLLARLAANNHLERFNPVQRLLCRALSVRRDRDNDTLGTVFQQCLDRMTEQWLATPDAVLLGQFTASAQAFAGSDDDCRKAGKGGTTGHSALALRDWTENAQSTMRCPKFRHTLLP